MPGKLIFQIVISQPIVVLYLFMCVYVFVFKKSPITVSVRPINLQLKLQMYSNIIEWYVTAVLF